MPLNPIFHARFTTSPKNGAFTKIKAKWYKFAALEILKGDNSEAKASAIDNVGDLEKADAYLARAHQLNPKSGVRTHRTRIAMRLRALTAE